MTSGGLELWIKMISPMEVVEAPLSSISQGHDGYSDYENNDMKGQLLFDPCVS